MRDSWLTPDAKVIEVGEFQHNDFASELLENELGFEKMMELLNENNNYSPYEILHDRGRIRIKCYNRANSSFDRIEILGGCIDLTKHMRNTINPSMNSAQIFVAKKICNENSTSFDQAINDKRFW